MALSSTSRKPRADNRPSIGYARHRRFTSEEQPTIGAFAHVLGHRVRGLLASIEGFTDLLIPSLDEPDQREIAFRILESTSRIEGILHDLQHYNDPLEAHFHKVPAKAIASDVTSLLADSEMERVEVLEHELNLTCVRADETLLRQAVMALLSNAFEVNPRSKEKIHLCVELSENEENVLLKVQNFGEFSDAEKRAKAFEPFFTTKASNLGLGLTLARRIARVHSGELSVTSEPDSEMTELTLVIPVLTDV